MIRVGLNVAKNDATIKWLSRWYLGLPSRGRSEIERFRRELKERGEHQKAESMTDRDLLREVMNTVGKAGRLGFGKCIS